MFDPGYEGPCRDRLMHADIKSCLGTNGTDPAVLQHVKALYDGEIRNMDAAFNRFLAMLESKGLSDRTCIIVTSDHGEEFKEHGKFFHNRASVYEELIRIPLIAWCPQRFAAGRSVDEQVSLIDIAPTILDLTGLAIPERMEGISLMPALRDGAEPGSRTLLSEVDASIEKREGTTVSVRDGRYKLIATNTRDAVEVYDLEDDPGEQRDVSAAQPGVTAQLQEGLASSVLAPEVAAKATERAKPPPPATPDPAVLERLRALGYIE
jgi:arylsulfatase A-like enzyme